MSNMSYCRFENTSNTIGDCQIALDDFCYGDEEISEGEQHHAGSLLEDALKMFELLADQEGKSIGEFTQEAFDAIEPADFFREVIGRINS